MPNRTNQFLHKPFLLFLLLVLAGTSSCTVPFRTVVYNKPTITSHRHFHKAKINKPDSTFRFVERKQNRPLPDLSHWVSQVDYENLSKRQFFRKTHTAAFLMVQNDTIQYENYFNGYDRDDFHMNFSISKSFIGALTGIAIEEGKFEDLDQPVADFLPSFQEGKKQRIKLKHVLNMTSGLNHGDYNHLAKLATIFYTKHLERVVRRAKVEYPPGKHFEYKSLDTQILGMCLQEAYGKSVPELVEAKLWQPLGMEYPAYWCLDRQGGTPKMFCGLTSRPRDLAKFGRLYLNKGRYNGKQILPESWVERTVQMDTSESSPWKNSRCFWMFTCNRSPQGQDFYAAGFGGQVIYIDPKTDVIVVRLGKEEGDMHWPYSISRLARRPKHKIHEKVSPQVAQRYEGVYEAPDGTRTRIFYRDGILRASSSMGVDGATLIREGTNSFVNISEQIKTIFEVSNEQVESLTLLVEDQIMKLKKVTQAQSPKQAEQDEEASPEQ